MTKSRNSYKNSSILNQVQIHFKSIKNFIFTTFSQNKLQLNLITLKNWFKNLSTHLGNKSGIFQEKLFIVCKMGVKIWF